MQVFLKSNADVPRTDRKLYKLYRDGEIENPEPTSKHNAPITFKKGPFKGLTTVFTAPGNLIVPYTTEEQYKALIKKLKEDVLVPKGPHLILEEQKRIPITHKQDLEKALADSKADLDYHKWKDDVAFVLRQAARIRDGQISDYLRVSKGIYIERAAKVLRELEKLIKTGREKGWDCNEPRAVEARLRDILNSAQRTKNRKGLR